MMPRLVSVLLLVVPGLVFACSSTSNDAATSGPGTGGGPDAGSTTTIDAADLGGTCSGGCGEGEACALEDATCPRGICGYDSRFGQSERWVGCSADCTNAACPAGWECVDALGPNASSARACMKLPEPRLKLTVKTQAIVFDATDTPKLEDLDFALDASVPASGGADGCDKVVLVDDDEDASHIVASMCATPSDGDKRIWELDFVVPKTAGRSTPDMTVLTATVDNYDGAPKSPICGGAVKVVEATSRGLRKGSISGAIKSPSCSADPPDVTFVLDKAEFELRTPAQ